MLSSTKERIALLTWHCVKLAILMVVFGALIAGLVR
jgi:hypothetical protein